MWFASTVLRQGHAMGLSVRGQNFSPYLLAGKFSRTAAGQADRARSSEAARFPAVRLLWSRDYINCIASCKLGLTSQYGKGAAFRKLRRGKGARPACSTSAPLSA